MLITQHETLRKTQFAHGGMGASFYEPKMLAMKRTRLKEARKRANLTQEAVAETMGVSTPQISRWENGIDGIPSARLDKMARAYKSSISELFDGGEIEGEDSASVMVEALPTHVGAGGGGSGEGDYKAIPFARQLVEIELRASPDDLLSIEIEGDSMKPEFLPGDKMLVDKRKRGLAQPGAFCLWDGDGYVVKYLEKVHGSEPPKIKVMSGNPRYEPKERLVEELQIMGRIVWFARRVG